MKILLVDDDAHSLGSTRRILEVEGFQVETASDGEEALTRVRSQKDAYFDLIISDIRMPKLNGMDFLKAIHVCGNSTPVILMTAFGRVQDAVWAMKVGAVDFLTKPFKRGELLSAIETARRRLRKTDSEPEQSEMIGKSAAMLELRRLIEQLAPTSSTVLIQGESGSGKELVARQIHSKSARKDGPFIALNCASIPEMLFESELYGHLKGSFTGATQDKKGLFEAANGGTLFLDEIGDMPLAQQTTLLRALQESEIRPVGSNETRKVDVRVLAATHRDLKDRVLSGEFREDLLYRLDVIGISIPPLRERMDDIPLLVDSLIRQAIQRHGKVIDGVSDAFYSALYSHQWPGNIRELANVVERAVILSSTPVIGVEALPNTISSPNEGTHPLPSVTIPLGTPLKDVEDLLIRRTLEATEGDKNLAAKLLGVNSRTIYRRLEASDK